MKFHRYVHSPGMTKEIYVVYNCPNCNDEKTIFIDENGNKTTVQESRFT